MKKKKFEDFEEMYKLCKLMEKLAEAPKESSYAKQPGERQAYENN